jgi:peptidoglycan/LPS O-acetylase OafA/YrhL
MNNFQNLASIRGGAALVVLLAHTITILLLRFIGLGTWTHLISSYSSYYAVITFFVLSGFLITRSIDLNIKRNNTLILKEYFIARFARIYPPFFVAVILTTFIFSIMSLLNLPGINTPLKLPEDLFSAREFLNLNPKELIPVSVMAYGLLDINGALWSLYIEVKIYLLFGLGYYFFYKPRQAFYLILMFLIVAIVAIKYNPQFIHFSSIWLVGSFCYFIFNPEKPKNKRKFQIYIIGFLIAVMTIYDFIDRAYINENKAIVDLHATWLEIIVTFLIAVAIFKIKIKFPFGEKLADCSYTIYIIHFPILLFFQAILIWLNSHSIYISLFTSLIALVFILMISQILGRIELKKEAIQIFLISLWREIKLSFEKFIPGGHR